MQVFKISKQLQKQMVKKLEASEDAKDDSEVMKHSNDSGQNVDSDQMVKEQIDNTMEIIIRMEATLAADSVAQENKKKVKQRRSAGNSPIPRSRS